MKNNLGSGMMVPPDNSAILSQIVAAMGQGGLPPEAIMAGLGGGGGMMGGGAPPMAMGAAEGPYDDESKDLKYRTAPFGSTNNGGGNGGGNGNGNGCLLTTMLYDSKGGPVRGDLLQPGMLLRAWDGSKITYERIAKVEIVKQPCLIVHHSCGHFVCSDSHEVVVPGKSIDEPVKIVALEPGDKMVDVNGNETTIVAFEVYTGHDVNGVADVVKIEMEGPTHTYIAQNVVHHNKRWTGDGGGGGNGGGNGLIGVHDHGTGWQGGNDGGTSSSGQNDGSGTALTSIIGLIGQGMTEEMLSMFSSTSGGLGVGGGGGGGGATQFQMSNPAGVGSS